jgi:hypothetical protein
VIDSVNSKVLFTIENNDLTNTIVRCSFDGTGCTAMALGLATVNDVDKTHSKLVLGLSGTSQVERCNLDLTGCSTPADAFAGSGLPTTGTNRRLTPFAVDAANQKLVTVALNQSGGVFGIVRSSLDGTGGTFTELMALAVNPLALHSIYISTLAIDPTNAKLLVFALGIVNVNKPNASTEMLFFRCELDGSNCTTPWSGSPPGPFDEVWSPVVDTTTQQLYASTVTWDTHLSLAGKQGLLICDLGFTNCTVHDPADGAAWQVDYTVRRDVPHQSVVFTKRDDVVQTDGLERCDLAGTSCTNLALPVYAPNALVTDDGHLTGVYLDVQTNQPSVFSLRMW